MIKEAKVFGVMLDHKWSYQGRSGIHHKVFIVWCDSMPKTDSDAGFPCEVLKYPVNDSPTDTEIRMLQPGDIVDIDFNRYNRPEYLKIKEHHDITF